MASSPSSTIPAETPLLSASRLISQALSLIKQSPTSPPSQDALSQLQLSLDILTKLDPYIESHSAPPPSAFKGLAEATVTEDWQARHKEGKTAFPLGPEFSAGPYEGMFVAQVVKSIRAKRVLEVGMFTGTTTLCIADQLPQGGKVIALEIDAYLAEFLQPHLKKAGVAEKVEVMTGKANSSIEMLLKEVQEGKAEPFDLIFIDADKTGYQGYFDQIINGGLLAKSGTLLVDNTLYKGAPLLPSGSPDVEKLLAKLSGISVENVDAVRKFNDVVSDDKRVLSTVLPIRDGVTWINWA